MSSRSDPREEPIKRAGDGGPMLRSMALHQLLPADVVGYELYGPGDLGALLPAERQHVDKASPKRAREFAAGRICARAALQQFGLRDFALVAGADHHPQWPRSLCGSITHTYGYCACVVGERGRYKSIGLDVERVASMNADVWQQICAPAEAAWLERLPQPDRSRVAALIFSAKEAFYKCQYPITREWLEFNDVTLDFAGWELDAGSFAVRPLGISRLLQHHPLPWLGRFHYRDGLVFAGLALAA